MKPRTKVLRESRHFVESEFGRGMASAKVSTNPKTLASVKTKHGFESPAPEKKSKARSFFGKLFRGRMKEEREPSTQLPLRKTGRKQFVYLKKTDHEHAIHELSHAAYRRKRKLEGKPVFPLVSETISSSMELEWLLKNNPQRFNQVMKNFAYDYENLTTEISSTIKITDSLATHTGKGVAHLLFFKFPGEKNLGKRIKLRKELADKNFATTSEIAAWVFRKMP